jgi:hypothetical protein
MFFHMPSQLSKVLMKLVTTLTFVILPNTASAGPSVNGTHRCEEGGTMKITGYNGLISAPLVVFKGKSYPMRPYTPVGATYLTFVDNKHSGTELGVGRGVFLVVMNGSREVERCTAVPPVPSR